MDVTSAVPAQSPPLYDDAFPALPSTGTAQRPIANAIPSYQPTMVTEVIEIPLAERKYRSNDESILADQSNICAAIGKSAGVKVELTNPRNKSLSVIVTGSAPQVQKAKLMILQDLQQQAQRVVKIPHEHHRFLIGFQGQRKRELEASTTTKIIVPPAYKNSNEITIVGLPSKLDAAEKEIIRIVDYHSQLAREKLQIPKVYHPFICGPSNTLVNEIMERTNTKIHIPPSQTPNCEIVILGKKNDVAKAVTEINTIYKSLEQRCVTIPCLIQRDKHRLVIGVRGSGLNDIFEKTGVVVEPPNGPDNEEFILRGYPEVLGRASTMVFQRAFSSATEEVVAPQRLHKFLIGKKGSALAFIKEGYEAVRIEFPNSGDKITVEGPPEEVAKVVERLKARISELIASHYLDFVSVDPKYHSKLLGSDGLIPYIRFHRLNVRFPSAAECGMPANSHHIYIDGEKNSVEMVKEEVTRMVKKWENEKVKDVIVEPRIQNLLRYGNPPLFHQIKEAFPEVEIRWPQKSGGGGGGVKSNVKFSNKEATTPSDYVIQLCGVRDQVNSAADKLNKLVKRVVEENQEQEVRIFKDCLQRILGGPIFNLLKETRTRIRYSSPSPDGSQPVVIIGRQEDVDAAVTRLEKLQKSLTNIQETTITLPTLMLSRQAANSTTPGARLRSIREQCEGVQLKVNPTQPRQLTISGPPEALEKAKVLIDSMCEKMLEHCADSVVYADPKYHGHLIGRNGAVLKKFRERHDVEVLFPDRTENDLKRASEIHIIGEKAAVAKAVEDLEKTVTELENETDATLTCELSVLKNVLTYLSAFHYPELERVRVICPRSPTALPTYRTDQITNGHPLDENVDSTIRILGPKGCVEDAEQCIKKVIEDVKNRAVVRYPITQISHLKILNRLRSSVPDMQRNYRVLITLQPNRDRLQEDQGEKPTYGHVVLTGVQESIDKVLETEIIPLLPVSEDVAFPREFYGKLFVAEQPPQQQLPSRRGQKNQRGGRQNCRDNTRNGDSSAHNLENGQAAPKSRLNALQDKFHVSISVPPRTQCSSNQITIRGVPDAIKACKAELAALEAQLQAEKADWEARNYEEAIIVEERYLTRIIFGQRTRLLEQYNVSLFTRARSAVAAGSNTAVSTNVAPVTTVADENNCENVPKDGPSSSNSLAQEQRYVGYRLVSSVKVPVVLHGYKEQVNLARAELEKLLELFKSFVCIELHVPAETHARLIGFRRQNIHRLEEKYDVDVEFPPRGANGTIAEVVLVMGLPDNVDYACNELINRANDICAEHPNPGVSQENGYGELTVPQAPPNQSDFMVVGAPWERNNAGSQSN